MLKTNYIFIFVIFFSFLFFLLKERAAKKKEVKVRNLTSIESERIKAVRALEIRQAVELFAILSVLFSFLLCFLVIFFGFYLVEKSKIEETIWEKLVIFLTFGGGLILLPLSAFKFSKRAKSMEREGLRKIEEGIDTRNYYLFILKQSFLILLGIAMIIFLFYYLGLK